MNSKDGSAGPIPNKGGIKYAQHTGVADLEGGSPRGPLALWPHESQGPTSKSL
jgi:hypothetical protein